jgi:hypothetical protein
MVSSTGKGGATSVNFSCPDQEAVQYYPEEEIVWKKSG